MRTIVISLYMMLYFPVNVAFRNFLRTPWELFALTTTPAWFSEGVSQYEAERWDWHRELLLENCSRHQALLPRQRPEGFMNDDELNNRLIYEQGHSLVRYVANRYGSDKIGKIYQSIPQIRPQLLLPCFDRDDVGFQFDLYDISANPLDKHAFYSTLTHRKRTHYAIDYFNHQFLPLLHFYTTQSTTDRSQFFEEGLIEQYRNFGMQFSFPINFGDNLYANIEYRLPLIRDLGLKIWYLYFEKLCVRTCFLTPDKPGDNDGCIQPARIA